MDKHRGEIVEAVIKASGYSIKFLSKRLGISRNTVYNKFKEHNLNYEFIAKLGEAIHYDFIDEFPEIKAKLSLSNNQGAIELWRLGQKYTRLLERYNALLGLLIKLSNGHSIKEGIEEL